MKTNIPWLFLKLFLFLFSVSQFHLMIKPPVEFWCDNLSFNPKVQHGSMVSTLGIIQGRNCSALNDIKLHKLENICPCVLTTYKIQVIILNLQVH